MDESESYFVPIRYGRQPIELKKGMFSIQCRDVAEVEKALRAVRALVLTGNFDAQLQKVSEEIRERFRSA